MCVIVDPRVALPNAKFFFTHGGFIAVMIHIVQQYGGQAFDARKVKQAIHFFGPYIHTVEIVITGIGV